MGALDTDETVLSQVFGEIERALDMNEVKCSSNSAHWFEEELRSVAIQIVGVQQFRLWIWTWDLSTEAHFD
jgi:hypothetical protein